MLITYINRNKDRTRYPTHYIKRSHRTSSMPLGGVLVHHLPSNLHTYTAALLLFS